MKKYRLIIVILLMFFSLPAELSAHEKNENVFLMGKNGYEPKNLTIHVGDTAIFKNISTEDRWPASNIHPTHEIYPEFDSGKPLTPGASWEFTFNKEGVWKYHDHLAPNISGTITVEKKTNNEESIREETENNPGFLGRVKKFFSRLFSKIFKRDIAVKNIIPVTKDDNGLFTDDEILRSYVYTFRPAETVKRLNKISSEFGDCHQPAHKAGRFAYEFFKEKAFSECSAECHSGCYHGATEAYFRDHGTKELAKNLATICGPVTNPFFNHQCIHGIGHGLTAWNSYDIPEALKGCDLLPGQLDSCYSGVFMENILGGLAGTEMKQNPKLAGHITKYLSDDPQFPCTIVDEKYKNACYFYQTSRMVKLFSADFKKIADTCNEAPEIYRSSCFQSMGRDLGGFNRGNPTGAIAGCLNAPAGMFRRDCIGGAVQDSFWDPSGQDNAITFCRLLTDGEDKKVCYDTIFGRATLLLAKNNIKNFCKKVEKPFQTPCASFADITL